MARERKNQLFQTKIVHDQFKTKLSNHQVFVWRRLQCQNRYVYSIHLYHIEGLLLHSFPYSQPWLSRLCIYVQNFLGSGHAASWHARDNISTLLCTQNPDCDKQPFRDRYDISLGRKGMRFVLDKRSSTAYNYVQGLLFSCSKPPKKRLSRPEKSRQS